MTQMILTSTRASALGHGQSRTTCAALARWYFLCTCHNWYVATTNMLLDDIFCAPASLRVFTPVRPRVQPQVDTHGYTHVPVMDSPLIAGSFRWLGTFLFSKLSPAHTCEHVMWTYYYMCTMNIFKGPHLLGHVGIFTNARSKSMQLRPKLLWPE